MVILGLWLAILGYGVAYSGVLQLGGGQCSLADAFRGRCTPKSSGARTTGTTLLAQQQAQQQQQADAVPSNPIPQQSGLLRSQ